MDIWGRAVGGEPSRHPGVGVGVIVVRDDGQILLVRRRHHGAGSWATPGGYLDLGESFEACAIRETMEETGLAIGEVVVVALANDLHADAKHNVTVWLAARAAAGEATVAAPDELDAVGWFAWDRLPSAIYASTSNFLEGRTFPPDARARLERASAPASAGKDRTVRTGRSPRCRPGRGAPSRPAVDPARRNRDRSSPRLGMSIAATDGTAATAAAETDGSDDGTSGGAKPMAGKIDRNDPTAGNDEQIVDGNLIVDERMVRRDGLVEYEGTVEGDSAAPAPAAPTTVRETVTTAETRPVVEETTSVRETVVTGVEPSDSLSMSTDNTLKGVMAGGTTATGPITLAHEGMTVVDASGEELGTVAEVQMGDPTAATAQGQDMAGGGGVVAAPVGASGGGGSGLGAAGGGVAAPLSALGGDGLGASEGGGADLQRVGFIRIDSKGLFSGDRYAAADEIADVSGTTVRLSVAKDALRGS